MRAHLQNMERLLPSLSEELAKCAMMKDRDNLTIGQMFVNCYKTVGSLI